MLTTPWIDRYADQADWLPLAIGDLDPVQRQAHPVPGTWSLQEIVIHLVDSDLFGGLRMKRVIAEDEPRYDGYHETRFAERLGYSETDVSQAMELFRINRRLVTSILRGLDPIDFDRVGHHSEDGRQTLGIMIKKYVEHVDGHFQFVRDKRSLLGLSPLAELNS